MFYFTPAIFVGLKEEARDKNYPVVGLIAFLLIFAVIVDLTCFLPITLLKYPLHVLGYIVARIIGE